MTLRRRFFPSTPVQQAIGQTVKLEVQLRPDAPVAAPTRAPAPEPSDCTCDVAGLLIAPEIRPQPGSELGGGWGAAEGYAYISRPRIEDGLVTGCYYEIPSGDPGNLPALRFMVIGRTLCNVDWTWELTRPPFPPPPGEDWDPQYWNGVDVQEQGGSLLVTVQGGRIYAEVPWWAELTATATCGGELLGAIVLRLGVNTWGADQLPPIP